jgi:predicted helicase
MSEFAIKEYLNEVEKIIHFGGTNKETAIRNAFYNLLNDYAKQKGLMIVTEIEIKATNSNKKVTPDGTLKDVLRQDWGYWESKDESDILDEEIKKKFEKGYPKENILFEDSQTAVLIQNGVEVFRVSMKDTGALHRIITTFVNFERPEVRHFRKAIELFKQDIPKVTETLRGIIISQEKTNQKFIKASESFLKLCHDSINPNITNEDVREMIIQHILTEDVFNTIFDETQFHRENNIARELEKVIHTFFTGATRKVALGAIQHYYQAINAAAAGIADHHEKQKFLKVIYETFYKSYNPKAADRLGVVYTPNEIVQFMIKGTDYLLNKHFNKFLESKGVDILDPATGTGTFVCDMIDYMAKDKLEYKYQHELHANELAILPYYISNLNIEYTYTQKMSKYVEFKNLCFVDTLDNIAGLSETVTGIHSKYKVMGDLFSITTENSQRIIDQNRKKISVIIGNPPYNANQANENDNNKNREYPTIDKRIKDTFIKNSTAQKTKVYDMYARFYRWAFDRLDENGVIAFVTNRSFIESRTFDGFRKTIQDEFDFAYIIDTQSDVRANPKIAGTTHNVFGIQTGVAIMFLVRKFSKERKKSCNIFYIPMQDDWKKEAKLQWLAENPLKAMSFVHIQPDKNNNWINLSDSDFDQLLPVADKAVKAGKSKKAIFEIFSNGLLTARDGWVYGNNEGDIKAKVDYLIDLYNKDVAKHKGKTKNEIRNQVDYSIKWSRAIKNDLANGKFYKFDETLITNCTYRPFIRKKIYFSRELNEMQYQIPSLFGLTGRNSNLLLGFSSGSARVDFSVFAVSNIPDYAFYSLDSAQFLPMFYYSKEGQRIENITDWALNQFVKHYGRKGVNKETIFQYVYAVLHSPNYRKKYELNLKRDFPRIPFYNDFRSWSGWGKELIELHINYESIDPYPLDHLITTYEITSPEAYESISKPKLKADKVAGQIIIDGFDTLKAVPKVAWEYRLGNRSALEWILDQYKESKPKDPTIAEKFNTYKFADYKTQVIDLLKRVCTVSVETMKIIKEMEAESK